MRDDIQRSQSERVLNNIVLPPISMDSFVNMADSFLRYTDLAAAIQLAKCNGMANQQIARALTGAMTYADALKVARRAAPLLDLSILDFMRLRKNMS